uniref:Protein translocase subunit SecA n=1 Tax=Ulnaria acus TaxID=1436140 RepID=H2EUZ5_9STRA|nr:secA gene product [Ulnaria acus]AEX37885.1 preprotein translocase subunit SecA [Ulnaria acus]
MIGIQFNNNKIFSNKTNVIPKQYQLLINDINELEKTLKDLTDIELRIESFKLQNEYKETQDLNSLISRSFALTRESSLRTLGLRHFDVQLMGGLVLNSNKIAEMKTGEGKTLVATLPASLNALTKKGVHIVTVNDYLANRDQVSMGQIYRFLGFDTGLIQAGMSQTERKENYQSDITYVTNYELTFDYLRDNTTLNRKDIVLPAFNYCIIDEVDSILIDEAQTPIILADTSKDTSVEKFIIASEITNYLEFNKHYIVDEKNKNVTLTELGSQQVEKIIQTQDLYNPRDPWIPYIINALKANSLFFNNIHYIIQANRIVIVDEFTGRIMPDRRWGDGLHQAIEAKEKLAIRPRTETQASITYQNFFLMYPKLSGMTGTGKTSEIEFEKIYNLVVEVIPTYKPTKRLDLPDLLYKDQFSKWNAIAQFCNSVSTTGQPLLIGTTTVEKSDMLAQLLNEYNLSYQILNAKPENVRRESEIVAQAGKKNSITISTNMAGRGTDIILGGNINFQIQKELYDILILAKTALKQFKNLNDFEKYKLRSVRHNLIQRIRRLKTITQRCSQKFFSVLLTLITDKNFIELSDIDVLRILQENDRVAIPSISYQCAIRFLLNDLIFSTQKHHKQENKIVKNLGGLCVVGTERNDSRRVDDQLRGRCGRQGDPGTSRFFVSLDDNLLRLFGGQKVQQFLRNQIPDDSPIESSMMTESLNNAQKQVEERAYEQRKNLFEYDEILDQQRSIIYFERRLVLESPSIRNNTLAYGEQIVCEFIKQVKKKEIDLNQMIKLFENLFGRNLNIKLISKNYSNLTEFDNLELQNYFFQEFWLTYQAKINQFSVYGNGNKIFRNFERQVTLLNINTVWQEHLEKISLLREAVGWRGYGQKNPLTEYKREAYLLFTERKEALIYFTLYQLFRGTII